jgi:hypothetical protein
MVAAEKRIAAAGFGLWCSNGVNKSGARRCLSLPF